MYAYLLRCNSQATVRDKVTDTLLTRYSPINEGNGEIKRLNVFCVLRFNPRAEHKPRDLGLRCSRCGCPLQSLTNCYDFLVEAERRRVYFVLPVLPNRVFFQ